MEPFQLLHRLPEELLQDIINRLASNDLKSLNLVSRWAYRAATPLIWREVNLIDCQTIDEDGLLDDHDDLPFLRKLVLLAKDPWLASCVHTLAHRCHLPPPAIFHDLHRTPFSGQTLSSDPRTTKLVQAAARQMTKLHTLRIIFGHPNVNDALLRTLFDKDRQRDNPVRRLWLENCRISAGCNTSIPHHPLELPFELDFNGLESMRFRRLPLRPHTNLNAVPPRFHFVNARGTASSKMQDGAGGKMFTTTNEARHEAADSHAALMDTDETTVDPDDKCNFNSLLDVANRADDRTYELLASEVDMPLEVERWRIDSHLERSRIINRGPLLDPSASNFPEKTLPNWLAKAQRERLPSTDVMINLLRNTSATLTSLCLDWVLTVPNNLAISRSAVEWKNWTSLFDHLFSVRFPHLRAFQLRNAITPETLIPPGLYLLDHIRIHMRNSLAPLEQVEVMDNNNLAGLEFMEAHPNLQCLAWPMDSFFSIIPMEPNLADRVRTVIDNLGRTLLDLRVDAMYSGHGELQSESIDCGHRGIRDCRRRFISDFASKMTKLESIKIEGGVPRDERREIVRALHACPLKKIVMIGVSCPIGNTWGEGGRDLNDSFINNFEVLESEHKDAIWHLGSKKPEPPPPNFNVEPTYGWPPSPPMIHTIASLHADTVTELKFCGYKGAPVLFTPTPITNPMLSALKYFNNLESLIMSVWLNTEFEEAHRDSEIIKYWLEARSPASTSLVHITDEEPEGWAKELATKYAPVAMAWQITSSIGPFLSEKAKARKGGVHVRASVCIGDEGGIFDIDLRVGKGSLNSDICLGYKGPREELEPGRRRSKLESRRWF